MRHFSHRRNIPHAHNDTHLYTVKVATILIPSFHGLRYERVAHKLGPTESEAEVCSFLGLVYFCAPINQSNQSIKDFI